MIGVEIGRRAADILKGKKKRSEAATVPISQPYCMRLYSYGEHACDSQRPSHGLREFAMSLCMRGWC